MQKEQKYSALVYSQLDAGQRILDGGTRYNRINTRIHELEAKRVAGAMCLISYLESATLSASYDIIIFVIDMMPTITVLFQGKYVYTYCYLAHTCKALPAARMYCAGICRAVLGRCTGQS